MGMATFGAARAADMATKRFERDVKVLIKRTLPSGEYELSVDVGQPWVKDDPDFWSQKYMSNFWPAGPAPKPYQKLTITVPRRFVRRDTESAYDTFLGKLACLL